MKKLLFTILGFGFICMYVSLWTANIYLLGFAELILFPTMFLLVRRNILNK